MLDEQYLTSVYDVLNTEHKKLLNECSYNCDDTDLQKQIQQINCLLAGVLRLKNLRVRLAKKKE